MGVNHFKGLFKELERVNIVEIVHITLFFHSFVGEKDNDNMSSHKARAEIRFGHLLEG